MVCKRSQPWGFCQQNKKVLANDIGALNRGKHPEAGPTCLYKKILLPSPSYLKEQRGAYCLTPTS